MANGTIKQIQYTRLIFGARCSLAIAIFVLQRTAKDFDPRQERINLVDKIFYVDDFVRSFQSTKYAMLFVSDSKSTLQKGQKAGFNITKFVTNKPNVLEMLDSEQVGSETENYGFLGLLWNTPSDFVFQKKKLSKIDQDAFEYTLNKL